MPTSHAAARLNALAAREHAAANPAHPSVWQPWETLVSQAESRLKIETAAALAELEQRAAAAGQLLNVAYADAAGPAAALRKTGWDTWQHYMAMADDLLSGIIEPATAAYDHEIAAARHAYDVALADAVKTYRQLLEAAQRGKADAGSLPKAI